MKNRFSLLEFSAHMSKFVIHTNYVELIILVITCVKLNKQHLVWIDGKYLKTSSVLAEDPNSAPSTMLGSYTVIGI